MTNLLSTEFIRRKILEGASPDAPKKFSVMLEGTSPDVPKNFGSAGALPSRKTIRHSLLAIRCRFGFASAFTAAQRWHLLLRG
jgi:hypothetical protein